MTFQYSSNRKSVAVLFVLLCAAGAVSCTKPGATIPTVVSEPGTAAEQTSATSEPDESDAPVPPPKFEVTDRVEITTSMGRMVVGLYGKSAPNTVANFLNYVKESFYDGKIFHRIIAGFMIQGGGYEEDFTHPDPDEPIRLELVPGLKHEPGTLSMARQPNNLHSATSQFFICVTAAPQLNGAYSAFGKVEEGEEVLYAISGVPTHSVETDYGKLDDVPVTPVVIETIRLLQPRASN